MIDTNLLILLIVCVIFMVYLGVEGFAQYQSYTQMLAAKYGAQDASGKVLSASDLTAKYAAMNLTGSALDNAVKNAQEWQEYNVNPNNDLYKKISSGLITSNDIKSMIGTGDKGKTPNKSWLTYYDATNYGPNSPDIVQTASGSFLEKKTGSRLNETTYIDTVNFVEDTQKAGGRTLVQCKSDDFNCIRNLTYSDPTYQPYQGDSSWQKTNSSGFPIGQAAIPTTNSEFTKDLKSTVGDCIVNCLNTYSGPLTRDRVVACATLCTTKTA